MKGARERLMSSRSYSEFGKVAGSSDRRAFIAAMVPIAKECLRVLKPGGHALVWALPRTSHWTATAWENAGFDVRDRIAYLFGSGFPKSLDVGKAIDKAAGVERDVIGERIKLGDKKAYPQNVTQENQKFKTSEFQTPITAPATDAAKHWTLEVVENENRDRNK